MSTAAPEPIGPPARRLVSVGAKLAGSTTVLILAVTAGVYLTLSRSQRETLLQSKEMSASAVTRLFVDSCTAGVVFGDETTIGEELATLGRNDDVEYAAVWSTDKAGNVVKRFGQLRWLDGTEPPRRAPSATRLTRQRDRVLIASPILDRTGAAVGATVVAFSLARENRTIAAIERTTLIVSTAVALGLVLLLMAMARVLVVGPLDRLVAAANDLEHGGKGDVDIRTADEVGQLALAFRRMAAVIRVREERLGARNRDMRLVLDNVGQGFVTLDLEGTLSEERSRVVDEWFGRVPPGAKFWEYLALIDPALAEWFQIGWTAIRDDVLPLSLCLDQLPKLTNQDGRAFELEYRPILDGESLTKLIVVITDITARIQRERAEQAQREMMSVFRHQLSDRAALDDFFAETDELVRCIVESSSPSGEELVLVKRQIHTVKGNTALFGIESVAACCHELENKLDEGMGGGGVRRADRDELAALWNRVMEMRRQLSDAVAAGRVELDDREYQVHLEALRTRTDHAALLTVATTWRFEPAAKRLALLGEQVQALASRLGRGAAQVVCEPTTLRLPSVKWGAFWSVFAHVIRNTVDHGVETAAVRVAAAKPAQARVTLGIVRADHKVVVSVSDDGPGVDWPTIAARARDGGLPYATRADLEIALLTDGISVRREATATSGRGVGLAAVRDTIAKLGGHITIESLPGRGTTFRFVLPESMLTGDQPQPMGAAASRSPSSPAHALTRMTGAPSPAAEALETGSSTQVIT